MKMQKPVLGSHIQPVFMKEFCQEFLERLETAGFTEEELQKVRSQQEVCLQIFQFGKASHITDESLDLKELPAKMQDLPQYIVYQKNMEDSRFAALCATQPELCQKIYWLGKISV